MANKADVLVRNLLPHEINVARNLPKNRRDLETTIAKGNKDKFHLPSLKESLTINVPKDKEKNTKDYPIKVKSDVDVTVTYSRTDSHWKIRIESNQLSPDTPTTVTVDVGEEGP